MPFFGDEYTRLQALDEIRKANSRLDQAFIKSMIVAANDNVYMDIAYEMLKLMGVSKKAEEQVDGAKNQQEAALMVDSMYQSGFAVREILTNFEGFSKYGSIVEVQSSSPQAYAGQYGIRSANENKEIANIFGSFLTELPRAMANQQSPVYQALKATKLAVPNGPVTAGGQLTDPLEAQKAKVYSDLFQDNAGYVRGLTAQIGNGALSTMEQRKVNIGNGALGTALRFGSRFMGPIGWGVLALDLGYSVFKEIKEHNAAKKPPLAYGAQNNISLEEQKRMITMRVEQGIGPYKDWQSQQKPPEVHITNNVYVTTSGDNGLRIGEDVFRALGEKMRADLIRSGSHLYKY